MKKRSIFLNILYTAIVLVVFLLIAEAGVRILGFRPDTYALGPTLRVEPEGHFFQIDTFTGYGNKPGRFRLHFTEDYSCICTHDSNGCRITAPEGSLTGGPANMIIWIFGCSNSYGWSLNDWETYPYKLQSLNPETQVVNYSVTGYGTVQSLLQLERDLPRKPNPDIVVLAYASLHDGRNVLTASRRKAATVYNFLGPLIQPYGSFDRHDSLVISKPINVVYNRVPLSQYSALVHFVERAVNAIGNTLFNGHRVSEALVLEMNSICQKNGIVFIVAGIASDDQTFSMLDFCRSRGIRAVDISLSNYSGIFSNDPYDGHPNPLANSYYAGKLNQYLHQEGLVPEEDEHSVWHTGD